MKRFLLLALFVTLAIFFAGPGALGIVDIWCYVVLGRAVTGVVWHADAVFLSVFFVIPAAGCAIFAGVIATEDSEPPVRWTPPPPPPKRTVGHNPPPTYERPPAPPNPPPPRDLQGRRG